MKTNIAKAAGALCCAHVGRKAAWLRASGSRSADELDDERLIRPSMPMKTPRVDDLAKSSPTERAL